MIEHVKGLSCNTLDHSIGRNDAYIFFDYLFLIEETKPELVYAM